MIPGSVLEVRGLAAGYGELTAVRDVTLNVGRGEIVALLGANGAGKSTTLKAIAGRALKMAGTVMFLGADITNIPTHRMISRGLALVPEGRWLFPTMTVTENLLVGGHGLRSARERRARLESVLEIFPQLRTKVSAPAGSLSGGQQQMVAIGRALMQQPTLLMLDEPCQGLAPVIQEQILTLLAKLRTEGLGILLVEQNVTIALSVATRGYVMRAGHVQAAAGAKELLDENLVATEYLPP
jgi:branched-chain amino acid transport system ATP-binding protein